MPRRSDGTLSNKKKDRVRREEYAAAKAAKVPEASVGAQDVQGERRLVSERIGHDVQAYHCANCESPVDFGSATCPGCNSELRWDWIQ